MPYLPLVDSRFELGRASLIREGTDLSFLACGETVAPAYEASELLAKEGIQRRVLSVHTVKPFDEKAVLNAATETGGVIAVEEHSVNGLAMEWIDRGVCVNSISPGYTAIPMKLRPETGSGV